jgi:hypothetical protein
MAQLATVWTEPKRTTSHFPKRFTASGVGAARLSPFMTTSIDGESGAGVDDPREAIGLDAQWACYRDREARRRHATQIELG